MRILYFTRDYSPHDFRFLSSLAETQHQVYSLRLERRGNQLEDRVLPVSVEQVAWKGGRKPARWQDGIYLKSDLKRVIQQVKPDLIHAGPIQTSALLAAWVGFHPLVSMSWGSDILRDADRNSWWRWATRFTLNHSDILIGDCQAVRQKAIQLGFADRKVVIFPWGVDLERFKPEKRSELRKRLGWEEAFVILSLRSWEPVYGVDVLVRAFITAASKLPQLRLFLLGNGSQASHLHQLVESSQMLDRVYFGGQVSQANLAGFYQESDLYVSASHSDGSSVSLMEALACGKPVVVSDIPGNREWVTDGQEGWMFADNNDNRLAEIICQAVEEPQKLPDMSKAARCLAEKRANWNINFQELLSAYEKAVHLEK
jgi:glycosyltransferase involved in cell wall biosynthesis